MIFVKGAVGSKCWKETS